MDDVARIKEYQELMKRLHPDKYQGRKINLESLRWTKGTSRGKRKRLGFGKTRPMALERDGHKCRICGAEKELHVHHIIPLKEGGTHELNNLITLCRECHRTKHEGEVVALII